MKECNNLPNKDSNGGGFFFESGEIMSVLLFFTKIYWSSFSLFVKF